MDQLRKSCSSLFKPPTKIIASPTLLDNDEFDDYVQPIHHTFPKPTITHTTTTSPSSEIIDYIQKDAASLKVNLMHRFSKVLHHGPPKTSLPSHPKDPDTLPSFDAIALSPSSSYNHLAPSPSTLSTRLGLEDDGKETVPEHQLDARPVTNESPLVSNQSQPTPDNEDIEEADLRMQKEFDCPVFSRVFRPLLCSPDIIKERLEFLQEQANAQMRQQLDHEAFVETLLLRLEGITTRIHNVNLELLLEFENETRHLQQG